MAKFSLFCVYSLLYFLCVAGQYDDDVMGNYDDPELNPADVEEPGCPKVPQLNNINLREMLGQWHLPYMSKHWIRYLAKSMHGKLMRRSSLGRVCVKVNLKPLPEGGTPNNTDATIWVQSKCPRTGAEWNLACAPQDKLNSKWYCNDLHGRTNDGDSFVYIADTDGKSWALVVRCFPNNGMNWAIFSKVKELDSGLVKSLLEKVEGMGFKLSNVLEIPYEKCMTKI
ncbi:hypothetical protein Ocin01_05448 [Orchesella cincta]|uniref:Apolipoprotein D n=1 Tax=Orchesella cincta TaxID=48709 RepID=A0A1D2N7I3_ORCCI|nr:hypothetical protein Ocin01_05448 [Orchesella cincta]